MNHSPSDNNRAGEESAHLPITIGRVRNLPSVNGRAGSAVVPSVNGRAGTYQLRFSFRQWTGGQQHLGISTACGMFAWGNESVNGRATFTKRSRDSLRVLPGSRPMTIGRGIRLFLWIPLTSGRPHVRQSQLGKRPCYARVGGGRGLQPSLHHPAQPAAPRARGSRWLRARAAAKQRSATNKGASRRTNRRLRYQSGKPGELATRGN